MWVRESAGGMRTAGLGIGRSKDTFKTGQAQPNIGEVFVHLQAKVSEVLGQVIE